MFEESRSNLKLLIVDDSEDILILLSKGLLKKGYKYILTAKSGLEAVKVIEENGKENIDLVILDWQMPDMDGLAVFEIIKEKFGTNFPAIMLTANENISLAIRFMQANGLNYVTKPADIVHLDIDILDAIQRSEERKVNFLLQKEITRLEVLSQKRADFISDFQDKILNSIHQISNFTNLAITHYQEPDKSIKHLNKIESGISDCKEFFSTLFRKE